MSLEYIEGIVERITFYNDENGYSVLRLRVRVQYTNHIRSRLTGGEEE